MLLNETLKNILNEAASATIQAKVVKNNKQVEELAHNYRTPEQQKILQNAVFETLGLNSKERKNILSLIESSKVNQAKNFNEFTKYYNTKFLTSNIMPYIADFISLVPNAKGYGKGELFFTFLNPNILINGGSGSFDLALNGDEAEVKEVKFKVKNGQGLLYNFKFGTENGAKEAKIRKMAQKYIRQYLYSIPSEEWPDKAEEKLDKGELNALISLVKKYEDKLKDAPVDLDVVINSQGDVLEGKKVIGNIFDPVFPQKMKDVLSNTTKITFEDIVQKTIELYGSSSRHYLFIVGQQTSMKNLGKICYKDKLGEDVRPMDFTQGKVKVSVICDSLK